MTMLARIAPSLRLQTVALAALFGFTTFFVSTVPTELPVPRPEALAPQAAKALACADGPSFEGHLTNTASTTAVATYSTTGNVYGYISDVVDDWSCTAFFRYDGVAWVRQDADTPTDGNFDWGNLINSTSVSCNWTIGETNYLKANSTTDCPDTDDEYALPIFLANYTTTMLETTWHADHTPDAAGDFGFIHSDCTHYYGSEEVVWNESFSTSNAANRPGSNCDPLDLESTNTSQTIVVDGTPPSGGSIAIEGGATWTNDPAVTVTGSGVSDSPAGVTNIRATVNAGSSWYGWQAYPNINVTLPSGDGTKTVHAQFKDANGNASSGLGYSDTIILDTVDPTGSISINGGATYATSTSASLTVSCSDYGGSGHDDIRFSTNGGGSWSSWESFTNPKALSLPAGDGSKTVSYQCRDNAENVSTTYSDSITLDTNLPTGSISINGGASTTYSTSVSLTLACDDSGGSGPDDMRFSANGSTWTSYETFATPKAYTLSGGDGTKTVYFQCTDNATNTSTSSSDTINLVTDVTPPGAPSIPNLDAASDSGVSNTDDITSDATPTFSGTAESGSTVKLYAGESLVGSGTATGGSWSITATTLTDGVHAMTATATDPATNESDPSSALDVTIDTSAPAAPGTPELATASDTGASSTDDITNDATPTIEGSGTTGTTVEVFDGATPVGSGSVVAGAWSLATSSLSDAAHSLTAKATDLAGNVSSASSTLSVTIDTAAPSAPSTPNLTAGSDTGASDSDDITNDDTPTLAGTAESGAGIALSDGTTTIGTGTATGGNWSITTDSLTDGSIEITARATDIAGNQSAPSSALAIELDTVGPSTPPGIPDLDATSDTGANATDDITNDATPLLVGTATEDDDVELVADSVVIASGTAGASGYALTASSLTDGVHSITAQTVDLAGNASSPSSALSITIDTVVPTVAFTDPDGFATQTIHEFDVTWTEDGTGSSIASRAIQRQSADALVSGNCNGLTFVDDDDPTDGASPRSDSELADSTCYRWRATVDDLAGNQTVETSDAIQTNLSGTTVLRLRVAPTAAVGGTVYASVAIEDGAGQPKDDYAGTLTISSTDETATFPGGTTGAVTHGNKEEGYTFRVLFSDAGTYDVSVSGPGATSGTTSVTVTDGALRLAAPATVYAGVPFKLAVIPRIGSKTSGPLNRAYAATVTFASSDPDPDYGQEVNGSNQYTFVCNCDGAHVFPTTLSEVGEQTVTVIDNFGVTDTITLDVETAPGGGTDPIDRIDVVQWPQGNTVDYYITASGPYQLLYVSDSCGQSNRPLSESGGLALATTTGTSLARFVSDPLSSIHDGIIPVEGTLEDEQYAAASLRFTVEHGGCGAGTFSENAGYNFVYTDGSGHVFDIDMAARWREFEDVPGNANFIKQGPDSPILSWEVVSRGGSSSATFVDATTGETIRYVPGGMVQRFTTRSPIRIYRVAWWTSAANGDYNLGPGFSTYALPTGTSTIAMNDVPYHNSCLDSRDLNGGYIHYSGADGRTGMISATGLFPNSTFPNTGTSPDGWGCDGLEGQPEPPEPNDPLRDALDKLGLDETLAIVDKVTSLSHMTWGDPVDLSTGAQVGETTDFALGGLAPALTLTRNYRSDVTEAVANGGTPEARADSLLGVGWATNLDWKLDIDPDGDEIIVRGEAAGAVTFRQLDDDSWSGPGWFRMTLEEDGTDWNLTRPGGDGYRFDDAGRLEAVFDQQAHELTLDWDGSGHLEGMTDAAGRTAEVTANGSGHITRIDLPDGRYVTYGYSADGFLASVRMLDGETMTYVTDERGRITKIQDPLGRTILTSTYDGRGRVVRQTDALGAATRFAYDRPNLVTLAYGPRGDVTMTCLNPDGTTAATLDALGGVREYTYDEDARPLSVTDELGRRTRYRYDAAGNPTHVIDAAGQTVVTEYDAKGRPIELTGTDGSTVTTIYDATTGGPETVTRTLGAEELDVATYAYNAAGLPEELGEPGGAVTTLLYDADGYLESSTDAEGRETTFTTDARGFVTERVGPAGNAPGGDPADHTTTWTYDALGRVLTTTDPLEAAWTSTYDEMGRLLTSESPLGALVSNEYDLKGQLVRSTRTLTGSLDATTEYEYDAAGNLTAVEDAEGRRTEFEHDLLGRRTLTRDAVDGEWLVVYDAAGQVLAQTDPTGRMVEHAYDEIGRITATTDTAGETTTYAYDGAGRLETITDPLDHETTYGYDWMGRQDEVTNGLDQTASVVFDEAGDVVSVTNARDKTTTFAYDDTHRLVLVTEPGGIETAFTYDDAGRLESRTNDRGGVESYTYDANGRPIELLDAASETWTTTYDDDGRIETTIDGEGQTVDYAFDLGGRLLSLTPDVGDPITFEYDDADRLDAMTDGEGTTTYGYDAVGRLTSSSRASRTTTYTWDDAGRPLSVTYPASGGTVDYGYDAAGRLDEISDWADRLTTFTYDEASRVTDIARPGDLTTEITYDALDRPLGVEHSIDATPTLTQGYTYDANGNLASYSDDAGTATFTYDDLDRLTDAVFPGSQTYAYAYDAVGNLTAITKPGAGTTTLAYDLADRITTSGYSYDDNGALTADPSRSYAYDAFGRLASATVGATTTSYTLDGAGRRTAETTSAVTTSFDLDLRGELATILSDGTRKYLPADPGAGHEQASTWYSALADQAGSPHSLVTSAGVQGSITRWDPYGGARPGSSATVGIGYGGEWRDPAGLIDLRARAYDPGLGRFVSRDGFAGVLPLPQTANRYSYALNGPYRYGDPSGRFAAAIYANGPLLLSIAVQSLPVVGDAYSALTGFIGYDPIAGVALSEVERAAAIGSAFVIGGGFHLLGRLAGAVPDAARLGRSADNLADVGAAARGVDGVGGATTSVVRHPFADGASHITTTASMERHSGSPTLAGPRGMFVSPTREIDKMLSKANSRTDVEAALGLEPGALAHGDVVRIDIPNPFDRDLRLPDPSMGNVFHRPHSGLTIGNIPEAVIDSPDRSDVLINILVVPGL